MQKTALAIVFFLATGFGGPNDGPLRTFALKKGSEFSDSFEERLPLDGKETLHIDLRNPTYKDGTLSTFEGGILKNNEIRIQAKKISYTENSEKHFVRAEGDLMVQYRDKAFVGKSFEFDFLEKRGTVIDGKTYISPFFIGGDEISIDPEGGYLVQGASLTTCENIDSSWEVKAQTVNVKKGDLLSAKNVTLRFLKIPIWLPSYSVNLKKFAKPLSTYGLTWDKGAGPRLSLRYRIYSWKDLALYLRGEYRLRKGFGGAFETEYFPDDGRSRLITKSYLASDVLPTDPKKRRRYRLQGEGHSTSPSGKTRAKISWDKYTDVLMPGDFKTDDFAINAYRKNEFYAHHKERDLLAYLRVRPRVNSFQSVKEELPTAYATMHPYAFPVVGIISDNWSKVAFQKLNYSDKLIKSLPNFSAARLESHHEIYRPIHMKGFAFTPRLGAFGIYYSDSPDHDPITFAMIKYGARAEMCLFRQFKKRRHIFLPYAEYFGYSPPTSKVDDHYIFSIEDGYNRMDQLKFGVQNLFVTQDSSLSIDLYTRAFFFRTRTPENVPKIYLNCEWNFPSFFLRLWGAYNAAHNTLDYTNGLLSWTVNEDAALTLELRYRSKYDWRKADRNNFILDVTRSERELLDSPISDQRMTLLTHMFFRLTPFWSLHLKSHHGFLRPGESPFNELRADLYTLLDAGWRMRISYMHTQRDDRVSVGFDLINK